MNKEWLEQQYRQTGSIYKIAAIAGCHPRTIHEWMRKHGIKMTGMRGKKHTEDVKERISAGVREANPSRMNGKKHTKQTKRNMSIARRLENNANWKGGITQKIKELRRSKEYTAWRKTVILKSKGRCEECGSNKNIEAHHIISIHRDIRKALDPNNGQALCKECHAKKNWRKAGNE